MVLSRVHCREHFRLIAVHAIGGNLAKRTSAISLLLAFTCPILFADQASFKNGDRLTGSIVKSDSKGVVMTTEIAGVLTAQWPQIQELRSDQRLHVGLADGKTLVGKVISREGKFEIHTATNTTVEAPAESVRPSRSPSRKTRLLSVSTPGRRIPRSA